MNKSEYVFNKQGGVVTSFLSSPTAIAATLGTVADIGVGVASQSNAEKDFPVAQKTTTVDKIKKAIVPGIIIGGGTGLIIEKFSPVISKFFKKKIV